MTGFDARADVSHFVYELIDAAGAHLYVGCTSNLPNRLGNHASSRDWADEIVRVEASRYPDMRSALDVEKELIQLYQPRHNVVHTDRFSAGGWEGRRARMAEAHAAGQYCRDRTCKQCPPKAHAEGRQCASGTNTGAFCDLCAGLLPAFDSECQDVAEQEQAWLRLAEAHGGQYVNEMLEFTLSDAVMAAAVIDSGITLGDLQSAGLISGWEMVRRRVTELQAQGRAVPSLPEPLRPIRRRSA